MNKRPSLLVVFLTVFIDLIGFGIVLPLLPRYSEKFGASGFMIGLIIASFSVMQFLLAPAWGRLSDRWGRRPVLLISNGGSVVAYALFALAAWPGLTSTFAVTVLLISRAFAGACGANLAVASAYIADITPPDQRSKGMALIGVAFGLGFILGPAVGALSAKHLGLAGPGWVASAFCLANFILGCFILVESRQPNSEQAMARPKLRQWSQILAHQPIGLLVSLFFLSTFCFVCYEATIPLLLGSPSFHPDDFTAPAALVRRLREDPSPAVRGVAAQLSPEFRALLEQPSASPARLRRGFQAEGNRWLTNPALRAAALSGPGGGPVDGVGGVGEALTGDALRRANRRWLEGVFRGEIRAQAFSYDEAHIGYIFAYCGLVSIVVQGGVIGRLVKRFGEARVIVGSLVILAMSLAILPYVTSLTGLLVALAMFSLGAGINRAPTMALISMYVSPSEQGATMGVAQSAGTLARIVGPVFATTLYVQQPHAPYLIAAVIAVAAGGFAWWKLRHAPAPGDRGGASS